MTEPDPPPGIGDDLTPWVSAETLGAIPAVTDLALQPEQLAQAAASATWLLYALSGRRWPGLRTATLRLAGTPTGGPELLPTRTAWPWVPLSGRARGCGARDLDPQLYPVVEVTEVLLDDLTVPLEQVEVISGQRIRLKRGTTVDPLAVNHVADEDGWYSLWPGGGCCAYATVVVSFTWGATPPPDGVLAATVLAVELAKDIAGKPCRLPGNVVSINRQGVSIALDPTTFLDKGRVGIPTVDLWLSTVNPKRLRASSTVWDPDEMTPERVS